MENKETIEAIYESMKTVPMYDPLTDQIVYVSEETYRKILEVAHKMVEIVKKKN